ncbi:uncharacterized protein HD556DRAFT_1536022 [Suillus plorans]|uniref:Uncharacterized protein n=1 Tax=Suillus plorans TaxID=116603 RepID=A0A9P7DHQ6_9AGAM|nr:uncharacterized protein HD556DRAFT_1536022 [Suillus plorans]KAG1794873.1 hypothetical protein HD556DRAFT_1536022 [Suillus plorans]
MSGSGTLLLTENPRVRNSNDEAKKLSLARQYINYTFLQRTQNFLPRKVEQGNVFGLHVGTYDSSISSKASTIGSYHSDKNDSIPKASGSTAPLHRLATPWAISKKNYLDDCFVVGTSRMLSQTPSKSVRVTCTPTDVEGVPWNLMSASNDAARAPMLVIPVTSREETSKTGATIAETRVRTLVIKTSELECAWDFRELIVVAAMVITPRGSPRSFEYLEPMGMNSPNDMSPIWRSKSQRFKKMLMESPLEVWTWIVTESALWSVLAVLS